MLAWLVALVVAAGLSMAFAGEFKADYSAPGADSTVAQSLLKERFPAASGDTVDVVIRTDAPISTQDTKARVQALIAKLAAVPHVANAGDPFSEPGAISADGRTALTELHLDVTNPNDMPKADSNQLIDLASAASEDGLKVSLGGEHRASTEGSIGAEGIGLAAAIYPAHHVRQRRRRRSPRRGRHRRSRRELMLTGLVAALMPSPTGRPRSPR